jgi:carboxyl-terminal processing protease
VLDGSAAQKADLRKGDRVLMADGLPFMPIKSLAGNVGKTVQLDTLRSGRHVAPRVDVTSEPALGMFLKATQASERVIESEGRRIGYIHLWTQASPQFRSELANVIYGKFQDTDAMILDLRDGFGGSYDGYGDPLFRPDVDITTASPDSRSTSHYGYGRPLIVLINEGSRSAKEMFANLFKISKRAKLIGSRTAGNVLAAYPMEVASWAYLEIPAIDIQMNGVRLEKNGVMPDIEVPREFDESGKDLVLARALEELKSVKHANRHGD